ncbi:MAG: LPS assembly protein LptD [Mariprofundus sp.]|nr:LPS assembly protein LptD [Mariprofundus sp.]
MLRAHRSFYTVISLSISFILLLIAPSAFASPVDIDADTISRSADGVVIARGHVVIKRQFDTLTADEVTYRSNEHVLEAKGHVIIKSDKAIINAEQASMHTGSKTGNMRNAVITLPGGERLTAERIKRIDEQTFEAEELTFSSCPIDQESWRIAAKHAVLDGHDGSLTARHTRFELWGVPVLYTPWWQQALKRKSGLLMPKIGSGKRRGTEVALPYYFAPSANWDATFTPHWMSARGFMAETELRHISTFGKEFINVAGINDTVTASNRSRLQGNLNWRLPAGMRIDAEADQVSDHDYLADYATGREISSIYLQSMATLSQSFDSQRFDLQKYGALQGDWLIQATHRQNLLLTSNATTLQIVPRLQSNLQWTLSPHAIFHFDQQSTRFDRRRGVDGWRVNLHPYVEIPWELAGGGITATLTGGAQHTRYWLNQSVALTDTTPNRTTGEASLQIRSDFERIGGDHTWRHVISPILRYDYIDAPDQSALPNFDSAFGLLTWSNLLSANRFSGYDRIEKTSRISLMLESRLQLKAVGAKATRDALIIRAGGTYDLVRKSVDNALQAAPTRPFSNLLGELIWQPMKGMRFYSSGQYNTANRYWATITSSVDWSVSPGNRVRVGYQFTDARYTTPAQLLDINASTSLNTRWQATGRWQYDLALKLSQQAAIGLQYNHACWKLGVEGYRVNRRSGTSTAANFGFRLLLEFKGLGSVGS